MTAISMLLRISATGVLLGLLATAMPQPVAAQTHQYGDIPSSPQDLGQPLPRGTLENNARPYEKETQQLGGSGNHSYLQVGALRCKPQDAMIGARIRRGTVVEFLQVVCAPVVCRSDGCLWGEGGTPYLGTFAGNPQGGNLAENMFCSHGYVVAGFRASSTAGDGYLADVVFECARQNGQPKPGPQVLYPIAQPGMLEDSSSSAAKGAGQPPPSSTPRIWASPIDDSGKPIAASPSRGFRVSQCGQFGATGLSVAVGRFGQAPAIEAFSMFCGGTKLSNRGASAGQ
jgi:hypothetical protein